MALTINDIPEPHRTRIQFIAGQVSDDASDYDMAIATGIASYQRDHETIDRDEAERRLLDLHQPGTDKAFPKLIPTLLNAPREWLDAYQPNDFQGNDLRYKEQIASILRAHMRWIDANPVLVDTTECSRCGQSYTAMMGLVAIGRCKDSAWQKAGHRDPKHDWKTVQRPVRRPKPPTERHRLLAEIDRLHGEISRYKSREKDFISALAPVCDGGQYRADVVSRIDQILRERATAFELLQRARIRLVDEPDSGPLAAEIVALLNGNTKAVDLLLAARDRRWTDTIERVLGPTSAKDVAEVMLEADQASSTKGPADGS